MMDPITETVAENNPERLEGPMPPNALGKRTFNNPNLTTYGRDQAEQSDDDIELKVAEAKGNDKKGKPRGLGDGSAAIEKMREIAQSIFDSTPGMKDEQSKILQGVKERKNAMQKGTIPDKPQDFKVNDFETMYKNAIEKFMTQKDSVKGKRELLEQNQHKYIRREAEYRDVIEQLQKKIKYHSTNPLEIATQEEKTDEQYRLKGIDMNDPEQAKEIQREREKKKENAKFIEANALKHLKAMHTDHQSTLKFMDEAQNNFVSFLRKERKEVMIGCENKLKETLDQLRKEMLKKKQDNQYNFKEKEKELNEHLETMTQVAQKIDDDNRILMKRHEELTIQFKSQEDDHNLLMKQLFYHKKESQKIKMVHARLKKQAEELQNADRQDQTQNELDKQKSSRHMDESQGSKNKNINSKRPNTTAMNAAKGPYRPFTGMNTQYGVGSLNFLGGRAVSATIVQNPKLRRFENLIYKLKKILESEKKGLRQIKTLCAKEIDQKNQLEKILRQCVDDVKNEIQKKRTESKVHYYQRGGKKNMGAMSMAQLGYGAGKMDSGMNDDRNLSKAEKQKILEVLLSQERVLTLLYDKTFPPRSQSQPVMMGNPVRVMSQQGSRLSNKKATSIPSRSANASHAADEGMRKFSYYGGPQQRLNEIDENDIVALEKEIDYVIRNQMLGSAALGSQPNIGVGHNFGGNRLPKKRMKTAGQGTRAKKNGLLGKKDLMRNINDSGLAMGGNSLSATRGKQLRNDLSGGQAMKIAKDKYAHAGIGSLGLSHKSSNGFKHNVFGADTGELHQ